MSGGGGEGQSSDKQEKSDDASKQDGKQEGKNSGEESKTKESNEKFEMASNNILDNERNIDWDTIKSDIENIYTSWVTIAADLKEIGVSQEQINNYGVVLDSIAIAIKKEDKNTTLDNIIMLYEFLPKFEETNQDNEYKKILECKYNLLRCYRDANIEDWEQFNNALTDLKMSYSNIMTEKEKYKGKISNLENVNVIIGQLGDIASLKDKDVFFIKYKTLTQEFNCGSSSHSK